MSWGEEYIEQKAEFVQGVQESKTGCDAVELRLIQIGGVPRVCRTADTIDVWLDNGPNIDLNNIHARIVGFNDVHIEEEVLDKPLAKESAAKITLPYDKAIGQILQVKLTPKISIGMETLSCPKKAMLIENLPIC